MNRRPYVEALPLAERLRDDLAPYCERGPVIAGSLLRHAKDVKDVELVAIPKTQPTGQTSLFDDDGPVESWNLLHQGISDLECSECGGEHEIACNDCAAGKPPVLPIKPGSAEPEDGRSWVPDDKWESKALGESRYFRLWLPRDKIRVDLFLATPQTWGAILAIRTGSADFSHALVQHWTRKTRGHFHEGRVCPEMKSSAAKPYARTKHGVPLGDPFETPEELDVFKLLGIQWVEPEDRNGPEDINRSVVE